MTFLIILLLLFFTLASGFCSLAQIAIFSLSVGEVKLFAQDSDPRKQQVARLLLKPHNLLVTLLFCDIAANILIQNTAAHLFGSFASWLLTVLVPLVITVIMGEALPKTIGMMFNTEIAYRLVPVVAWLQKTLHPLIEGISRFTSRLSHLVFFFLKKESDISKEELFVLLKNAGHSGILAPEEVKLMRGYLSLEEVTVKERMQPRNEIFYYDLSRPLSELIVLFADKACSRVPLVQGDLQNILGILSAQQFFIHRKKIDSSQDLIALLKKPYFVPETIAARTLLRQFFYTREEMGIVVDEYGSISGLITREDLFEVVVGEIFDRRDDKIRYTPAGKDVIITSGKFEISEFEELFHTSLPSENHMVTLGGWLTEQMGDIPQSGDKYVWKGFLFHILAADANRVSRIYIRRLQKTEKL